MGKQQTKLVPSSIHQDFFKPSQEVDEQDEEDEYEGGGDGRQNDEASDEEKEAEQSQSALDISMGDGKRFNDGSGFELDQSSFNPIAAMRREFQKHEAL